jgi:hypothetical protein
VAGDWPAPPPPETAERELAIVIGQDLALLDEQPDGVVTGTVLGSYDGLRGFYAARGYRREELVFMENGLSPSPQVFSLRTGRLLHLRPSLPPPVRPRHPVPP